MVTAASMERSHESGTIRNQGDSFTDKPVFGDATKMRVRKISQVHVAQMTLSFVNKLRKQVFNPTPLLTARA